MDAACKSKQDSSELIFQLAKTSQATGDLGKVPTLTKLPISLSISPQRFHILRNLHYNITCQWNSTINTGNSVHSLLRELSHCFSMGNSLQPYLGAIPIGGL